MKTDLRRTYMNIDREREEGERERERREMATCHGTEGVKIELED